MNTTGNYLQHTVHSQSKRWPSDTAGGHLHNLLDDGVGFGRVGQCTNETIHNLKRGFNVCARQTPRELGGSITTPPHTPAVPASWAELSITRGNSANIVLRKGVRSVTAPSASPESSTTARQRSTNDAPSGVSSVGSVPATAPLSAGMRPHKDSATKNATASALTPRWERWVMVTTDMIPVGNSGALVLAWTHDPNRKCNITVNYSSRNAAFLDDSECQITSTAVATLNKHRA